MLPAAVTALFCPNSTQIAKHLQILFASDLAVGIVRLQVWTLSKYNPQVGIWISLVCALSGPGYIYILRAMKSSTSILVKMPTGLSSSMTRTTGDSKNLGNTSSKTA